ncbi:MAG TPA: molybdopterin cofactor-binding domain-containing protein, partial [Gemmatimonadota bacterium]|nr:molybdopterin cofactor-binding domain-containing protein [Gemmatimonadota bacterium]
GLDPAEIVIAPADTSRVPDSGPTVASRPTMVGGGLVERACDALIERMGGARGRTLGDAIRAAVSAEGEEAVADAVYSPPPGIRWDDSAYRGDAYAAYGWATYVAEVEVDLRTYGARVVDFVALQEVGRILNEPLARGQVQGGVVQGIGWALMEDVALEDGAMANPALTNYVIPTSDDVPPIRVAFEENPYPYGAGGAKGLGELPIDGPAPAVVNAIARALGVQPSEIPLTPERLMATLDAAGEADAA